MENLHILIFRNVTDWLGVRADEVLFENDVNNQPAYKALALICTFYSDRSLREFSMSPQEISKYFGCALSCQRIHAALNQHPQLMLTSRSYELVFNKVKTDVTTYLKNIYEQPKF